MILDLIDILAAYDPLRAAQIRSRYMRQIDVTEELYEALSEHDAIPLDSIIDPRTLLPVVE